MFTMSKVKFLHFLGNCNFIVKYSGILLIRKQRGHKMWSYSGASSYGHLVIAATLFWPEK